MPVDLTAIGTGVALAAVVGVTPVAASEFMRRAAAGPGATLGEWVILYCANLRKHAAGRGADNSGDLTAARIRESTAKAMRYELDVAERLRQLVPADEIEPALRDWAVRGGQAIESAAERIVEHIESAYGITLEDQHVRDHLRAVARTIAAYPRDVATAPADGRGRLGATSADSDG